MASRPKLRDLAALALLTTLLSGPQASAGPPESPRPCVAQSERCPICGGSFEEFQQKYFYVVRQSVRLVAWLAS